MTRPVRVLLVANDGFSAGHVARALAIARGLGRAAAGRGLAVRTVLATTSEAHALWADEALAVVTLPAPAAARRAGLSDAERRKLARAALAGVVDGFGPDLLVVDTFPSGPHGELAGLCGPGDGRAMKRALIRRATRDRRPGPRAALPADLRDVLTAGLDGYDLAVLAGDPGPQVAADLALPAGLAVVAVPPITLAEGGAGLDRAAARARLGLGDGRAILVAAGGGGDGEAAARAAAIAEAIVRVAPDVTVVIARGPLAAGAAMSGPAMANASAAGPSARIRVTTLAPLQPVLAAFDGAFSAAGYNTAHELAKARVPAALFAQPRSFDDQAGRAARFAAAGLAYALIDATDDAIAAALAWMQTAQLPALPADGAERAADALLDLVTGGVRITSATDPADPAPSAGGPGVTSAATAGVASATGAAQGAPPR